MKFFSTFLSSFLPFLRPSVLLSFSDDMELLRKTSLRRPKWVSSYRLRGVGGCRLLLTTNTHVSKMDHKVLTLVKGDGLMLGLERDSNIFRKILHPILSFRNN